VSDLADHYAEETLPRCQQCRALLPDRFLVLGCKEPCPECRAPFPVGDCSDG